MSAWLGRNWRNLRESLRWRGLFITTIIVLREILKPILYWYAWHIFTTEISREIPPSYAKDELEGRTCAAQDDLAEVKSEIVAMGELSASEVDVRFKRNDFVTMAYAGNRAVGYTWIARSPGLELAYKTYWIVLPGEGIRYGTYVIPDFRGHAVQSFLGTAINTYARAHGIVRTFASVSLLNPQSESLARHLRRTPVMTVFVARVKGLNWTIRKSKGALMESRFTWSKGKKESA